MTRFDNICVVITLFVDSLLCKSGMRGNWLRIFPLKWIEAKAIDTDDGTLGDKGMGIDLINDREDL